MKALITSSLADAVPPVPMKAMRVGAIDCGWVRNSRVVLLLDNNIYALTKKQTSPTTNLGITSNTQPYGSYLPALNPLTVTLGVTNASFVAQTAEWSPPHLEATLRAAYAHPGFAFVRILQRCPVYMPEQFQDAVQDRTLVELLTHEHGVQVPQLASIYKARRAHDPSDIHAARRLAEEASPVRLGVFFRDPARPRYEETRRRPSRYSGRSRSRSSVIRTSGASAHCNRRRC